MNRTRMVIKSTLCMTAATTVLMFAKAPTVSATSVNVSSETGIAGISLSIDKYYTAVMDNQVQESEVDLDKTAEEATPNQATEATPVDQTAQANQADADAAAKEEAEKQAAAEAKAAKYKDMAISTASSYVNIRKEANETSEILGKLYKGAAATVKKTEGDWVKVTSGSVTGYIKKDYLAIGEAAEKLADKYGVKLATIKVTTVRVREKKNTDCTTLTLVPEGEEFEVIKEEGDWIMIAVDEDIKGYIRKDCVSIEVVFDKAISIAEEKAKEEEAAQAAAEEAQAAEETRRQQEAAAQKKQQNTTTHSNSSTTSNRVNHSTSNHSSSTPSSSGTVASGSGSSVASFALKHVGRPYAYGQSSLTSGTDCSGFTKSVYAKFGISIPRTSSGQAAGAGSKVSLGSLQAGDLVFYKRGGSINHVAMYIGGGKVVHASNPRTGITVSNMNYRTPAMAKRVVK